MKKQQGIIQKREQLIQDLETWYFGVPFKEWHQKTEVGEWRDILNEACRRMVDLQSELEEQQRLFAEEVEATSKRDRATGERIADLEEENARIVSFLNPNERGQLVQMSELKAENERLRGMVNDGATVCERQTETIESLEAENDRLRNALRRTAYENCDHCGSVNRRLKEENLWLRKALRLTTYETVIGRALARLEK